MSVTALKYTALKDFKLLFLCNKCIHVTRCPKIFFFSLLNMQDKLWLQSHQKGLGKQRQADSCLSLSDVIIARHQQKWFISTGGKINFPYNSESISSHINIIPLQPHAAHPDVMHLETILELCWMQRPCLQTGLTLSYFIVGSLVSQSDLAGRGPLTLAHTPSAFLCRVPNAELPSSPMGSDLLHLLHRSLLLLLPLSSGENWDFTACWCR